MSVQVGQPHFGGRGCFRVQRGCGKGSELFRTVFPHQFRQHGREVPLQRHLPGEALGFLVQGVPQQRCDVLEGLVLQQPGEQQVPGLEERHVFLVFHLTGRQEPGRLEVQQRRGDHQELAGLIQGPVAALLLQVADVLDEFIGHRGNGHLGDVQLVLGDQGQEQVEGAREVGKPYFEAGFGFGHGVARVRRRGEISSFASRR